jgi:hypothetical protein
VDEDNAAVVGDAGPKEIETPVSPPLIADNESEDSNVPPPAAPKATDTPVSPPAIADIEHESDKENVTDDAGPKETETPVSSPPVAVKAFGSAAVDEDDRDDDAAARNDTGPKEIGTPVPSPLIADNESEDSNIPPPAAPKEEYAPVSPPAVADIEREADKNNATDDAGPKETDTPLSSPPVAVIVPPPTDSQPVDASNHATWFEVTAMTQLQQTTAEAFRDMIQVQQMNARNLDALAMARVEPTDASNESFLKEATIAMTQLQQTTAEAFRDMIRVQKMQFQSLSLQATPQSVDADTAARSRDTAIGSTSAI